MDEQNNKQKDRYEMALEAMFEELSGCQKEKNLDSCLKCQYILGCPLRTKYVDSVYVSMNKGHGGGFEF